jgi:sugar lactone lactonase YvrE
MNLIRLSRLCRSCLLLLASTQFCGHSPAAGAGYLLVAGQTSNNVVRFDVATGAASLYASYSVPSNPRGLALDDDGYLYSSVNAGNRNVVKFVPQGRGGLLASVDFTPDIGNFGPGQIQFYMGDLFVAGDRSRVIFQYDGDTGAEIRRFSVTDDFNIRGMTIADQTLYYSEIFQQRVRRMDLAQSPPTGATFFTDSTHLNEPMDMIVGGNGNLFITNRASTLVQEYDIDTGQFVKTLADLSTFTPPASPGNVGIAYDPALDNYFLSTGSAVYRVSPAGGLLQTYQSPLLSGAYGIVVVPEPTALVLALPAAFCLLLRRRILRRKKAGWVGAGTCDARLDLGTPAKPSGTGRAPSPRWSCAVRGAKCACPHFRGRLCESPLFPAREVFPQPARCPTNIPTAAHPPRWASVRFRRFCTVNATPRNRRSEKSFALNELDG